MHSDWQIVSGLLLGPSEEFGDLIKLMLFVHLVNIKVLNICTCGCIFPHENQSVELILISKHI